MVKVSRTPYDVALSKQVCVLSTLEDQTNIYTVFTTSSVVRIVASLLQLIVLQVLPETFFKQVETCFKKIAESV